MYTFIISLYYEENIENTQYESFMTMTNLGIVVIALI